MQYLPHLSISIIISAIFIEKWLNLSVKQDMSLSLVPDMCQVGWTKYCETWLNVSLIKESVKSETSMFTWRSLN